MTEAAQNPPLDGAFLAAPPPLWSPAFHLSFLPRVIALRIAQWRRKQDSRRHVHIELPLVIFGCLILLVLGLPGAVKGSFFGWACALAGAGGLLALMTWSIIGEARARRKEGYRYDYVVFMPSVFFCCLLMGLTAGLIAGGVIYNLAAVGYLWAALGLVLGYLAGIFAARWVHALGFMGEWFVYLAILGMVFLPFEDLIVVLIYAYKDR